MEHEANPRLLLLLIAGVGLVSFASIVAAFAWPDPVVCEISGDVGGCADDDGSVAVVYVSGFLGAAGACMLFVSLVGYGVKFGQLAANSEHA